MTDTRKIAKARATGGGIVASVAAAVLTLLFIIDAGGTRDAVLSSLRLSATSVIPAVFPCAVLSGLIVRLGGADKLGRLAERPMRLLFALPGEAFCAIFLGFLCGFPVGAKTCTELFDRGSRETARLLKPCLTLIRDKCRRKRYARKRKSGNLSVYRTRPDLARIGNSPVSYGKERA